MKNVTLTKTAKLITISLLLCLSGKSHADGPEGAAPAAAVTQPPGSASFRSNGNGRSETTVRSCNIQTVTHTFQGTLNVVTQGLGTSGDSQINRNSDGSFTITGRASVGDGSQYMLPAGTTLSASGGQSSPEQVVSLFTAMAEILQRNNGLQSDGRDVDQPAAGAPAPGQPISAQDAIALLQAAQNRPSDPASLHVFDAYLAALQAQRSASVGTAAPISSSTITESCRVNTSTSSATNEITITGSEENGYQVASLANVSNSVRRQACGNMAGLFRSTRSRTACR